MAYAKQTWVDGDVSTPLSATRLNHMENGIAAAAAVAWEDITGKPAIPTLPAAMTAAEATAGTVTASRLISPKVLTDLIDAKIAAALAE